MERIKQLTSLDIEQDNIEKLKNLFPMVFSENKLIIEKLQILLGDYVQKDKEFYQMTWAGKTEAQKEANKISTGTLRPCKEESKDWANTSNIIIEGDNLEVLKLLQKSFSNKVGMIYIDPPYNTGSDFVYKDNYKDNLFRYLEITGQINDQGKRLSSNTDSDGRFHSNWLNMMYPRLKLARNLLSDNGVIFISIDDNEMSNLKKLCDEIFGEENCYGTFVWQRRSGAMDSVNNVSSDHEYVLCYGKLLSKLIGLRRTFGKYSNPDNDPRGPWIADNLTAGKPGGDVEYAIEDPATGHKFLPPKGRYWPYNRKVMQQKISEGRIIFPSTKDGRPLLKRFQSEAKNDYLPLSTWIKNKKDKATENNLRVSNNTAGTKLLKEIFEDKIFDHPKPIDLIESLLSQTADDAIILDFFAGSGTTGHAVMSLNAKDGGTRRCISIQLPEPIDVKSEAYKKGYRTIVEITKERIRRAGELVKKNTERNKLDVGFRVFKLDTSNIISWDTSVDNFEAQLDIFDANNGDHIKPDRSNEDVLFEILLKYGQDLTVPIEEREFAGVKVYNVGFGYMYVCLANTISSEIANGIGEWYREFAGQSPIVIFKDSGFSGNDALKTNIVQTLRQLGIDNIKSI